MTPPSAALGTVEDHLRWVEEATGGTLCFHDLSGMLEPLVGTARLQHRNAPCQAMKRADPVACTRIEVDVCQGHLAQAPAGFWKRCHAGWLECYVPLRLGGELAGALFLGPWRWQGRVLPAVIQQAVSGAVDRPGPPPLADPERLAAILAAACHLGAWLERELSQPPRGGAVATDAVAFAQPRLVAHPSLADFAAFLGVSASTASRRVREVHGCTWPALLIRLRIERAERLLSGTDLPLAHIATRCGLADASYLHRLFRRQHACTPQQWREQARRDGSVPGIA